MSIPSFSFNKIVEKLNQVFGLRTFYDLDEDGYYIFNGGGEEFGDFFDPIHDWLIEQGAEDVRLGEDGSVLLINQPEDKRGIITSIYYGFLGGNLFSGDEEGIDLDASVEAYAEMVLVAIQDAFPNVEDIDVQYTGAGVSGSPGYGYKGATVYLDDVPSEMFSSEVNSIAESVYLSFLWQVEEEPEDLPEDFPEEEE